VPEARSAAWFRRLLKGNSEEKRERTANCERKKDDGSQGVGGFGVAEIVNGDGSGYGSGGGYGYGYGSGYGSGYGDGYGGG
jgi:hypothetical protein